MGGDEKLIIKLMRPNEVKCFKVWDRGHIITRYQHLNLVIVTFFIKSSVSKRQIEAS